MDFKYLCMVLCEGPKGDLVAATEKYKQTKDEEFAYVQKAYENGGGILIGRFGDPTKGAAAIFETQEQAEAFMKDDPLVRVGLVTNYEFLELRTMADAPALARR